MKMPSVIKKYLLKALTPERYCRITTRFAPRVRARSLPLCRSLAGGRTGVEIGGPSRIFQPAGLLPLYPVAARIDNCNFSSATTWEGQLAEGLNFRFDRHCSPGYQFIREASDLQGIADGHYDFLLSSHCIEHLANPLGALREWQRVVRCGGVLILVAPHREGTFDHRRPVTTPEHLLEDDRLQRPESDLTHLEEVLALHDLERDPGSTDADGFRTRSIANPENRCLHHHVFDTAAVIQMLDHAGLELLAVEAVAPAEIITVARRLRAGTAPDNSRFLGGSAEYRRTSPFAGDRWCPDA